MKFLASLCLMLIFSSAVMANNMDGFDPDSYQNDPKYHTVSEIEIVIDDAYRPEPLVENVRVYQPENDQPAPPKNVNWAAVVAIGEKVYDIVEKGKPVTESKMGSISCVPPHLKDDIFSMFGARSTSGRCTIRFKNIYSLTVARFDLRIEGYYNLQTSEHRGYYIRDAAVRLSSFECMWGYTCKASVKNSVINIGGSSTPTCEASMLFDYHVSTVLKHGAYSSTFRLNGRTGAITES
ncbi:hypothetical protein PCE1_004603 [Barthelona sp. PCE]